MKLDDIIVERLSLRTPIDQKKLAKIKSEVLIVLRKKKIPKGSQLVITQRLDDLVLGYHVEPRKVLVGDIQQITSNRRRKIIQIVPNYVMPKIKNWVMTTVDDKIVYTRQFSKNVVAKITFKMLGDDKFPLDEKESKISSSTVTEFAKTVVLSNASMWKSTADVETLISGLTADVVEYYQNLPK